MCDGDMLVPLFVVRVNMIGGIFVDRVRIDLTVKFVEKIEVNVYFVGEVANVDASMADAVGIV